MKKTTKIIHDVKRERKNERMKEIQAKECFQKKAYETGLLKKPLAMNFQIFA